MATQASSNPKTQILEKGNIYFLYRPKVEKESVESIEDVQRLYLVLEPHGRDGVRLIAIGKKRFPKLADKNQQGWCFVESVADSGKDLEVGLRQETYHTKTRGDRTQPAARPVGEGVYKIVQQEEQTRLLYALELPHELGEAQQAFNIGQAGNYVITVKNPEKSSPEGLGFQSEERKADLPQSLQEKFSDRRFIALNPTDFLDYVGTEFILISTHSDSADDIGIDLSPKKEEEDTAEIVNKLRMRKTRHPLEPLMEGEFE